MAKCSDNSAVGDLFAAPPTLASDPPAPAADQSEIQAHVRFQLTKPAWSPEQIAAQEAEGAENLGKDERYLKDSEVAKRFGIARQTVWKRVERGYLPAPIKLPPNSTRWRLSSLLAFEKALAKVPDQAHQGSSKSGGVK